MSKPVQIFPVELSEDWLHSLTRMLRFYFRRRTGILDEDMTQDTLVTLFRLLPTCRFESESGDEFYVYLQRLAFGIAKNRLREAYRETSRNQCLPVEAVDKYYFSEPQLDEKLEAERNWRRLQAALLNLSANERDLIENYYSADSVLHKNRKELAAHTGLTPAALKARVLRIRKKLKRDVESKMSVNVARSSSEDRDLREDFDLAFCVLGDKERAIRAISRARAQVPSALHALRDNSRKRYEADKSRPKYRPLIIESVVARLVLLDELKRQQIEEENAGVLVGPDSYLIRFVQEMVATVLTHNSFHAAVGIAQVLCDYNASKTLMMYGTVAEQRAESKDLAAVSRTKEQIMRRLIKRFGARLAIQRDRTGYRFRSRRPNLSETQLIKHYMTRFLPVPEHVHPNSSPLADLDESTVELNRIRAFFDVGKFNEIAARAGETAFDAHLQVPIWDKMSFDDGALGSKRMIQILDYDIDQLKIAIAKESMGTTKEERSHLANRNA